MHDFGQTRDGGRSRKGWVFLAEERSLGVPKPMSVGPAALGGGETKTGMTFSKVSARKGLPWWKRGLDLLAILLLLPGVVLVASAVALIVKVGSPGPVLFRQPRVGYRGRQFVCFKFRTMRPNAETESHRNYTRDLIQSQAPMTKLDAKNDPRLIPGGAILRATGLDELPQLINVVKGEMSLVGPRPCIPYEYELYNDWQRRRFDSVPGLTGLWQVSGKNRTTFEEMIRLDIRYGEQLSLWQDLRIMFKTLPALLCQARESRARKQQETACAPSGIKKSVPSYRI